MTAVGYGKQFKNWGCMVCRAYGWMAAYLLRFLSLSAYCDWKE